MSPTLNASRTSTTSRWPKRLAPKVANSSRGRTSRGSSFSGTAEAMAIYRILFRPSARRDLAKLPPPMKVRIGRAIEGPAQQPRPAGALPLSGSASPTWRIRVGDYRILYEIHNDRLVVLVVAAGHRREVYRGRRISEAIAPYPAGTNQPAARGGRSWTSELQAS